MVCGVPAAMSQSLQDKKHTQNLLKGEITCKYYIVSMTLPALSLVQYI